MIQKALRAEPERWRWSIAASGDLFITLVAKELDIDTSDVAWKTEAKKAIKEMVAAGYVKKGEGKGNKNKVPVAQCGDKTAGAARAEVADELEGTE